MTRAVGLSLHAPPPRLGEALDFMRLIWALDHALQKTSKRMKSAIGVTGPQRLVVRIVARFPGIPAGQIAHLLHVHPSTLTGILKRLERQGLIRRRSDPRDRRRAFLGITEKGRRIDGEAAGTIEAAVERVISRASRTKLESAREILVELATALSGQGRHQGDPMPDTAAAHVSSRLGRPRAPGGRTPRGPCGTGTSRPREVTRPS